MPVTVDEEDDKKKNRNQSVSSKNAENANTADRQENDDTTKSQKAQSYTGGYTSDEWKQLLDGHVDAGAAPIFLEATYDSLKMSEGMEITALKEVLGNKFPKNFTKLSLEEKEEKIQELKDNLNASELSKFNVSLIQKAKDLAEVLPPHQLVVMSQDIDKRLEGKDGKEGELASLEEQSAVLLEAMYSKLNGYVLGDIIVDGTNVADVYDGAMEMFDYIENNLSRLPENVRQDLANKLNAARNRMNETIDNYDRLNGLVNVKEGDEKKLEEAFDDAWEIAKNIDINDKKQNETWFAETGTWLQSLNFENPDADKKKEIFIETIKATAARNAAVAAYGKDKQALVDELKNQLQVVTGTYINTLKSTDALANLPEDATDEQRREAVGKALNSNEPISDKGLAAFQAATVNNHVSFLNRLAGKAHLKNRAAPVLSKMYGPIAKIDKACIARFGKSYEVVRTFGKMMARNMGAQALNQALRIGCNTAGLALGVPGLGSQIYAGVYATQAIYRLTRSYIEERKASKEKGLKFFGKFLLQKSPEILMTAATTTAIVFGGKIAEYGMQKAVRYGMMAFGFATSVIKGARNNRKAGDKWGKAILKSVTNSSLSTGTAVLTGMGLSYGVNLASEHLNNVSLDLWGEHGTRPVRADEYNPDDASYTKTAVTGEELNDYKNMTPDQLNENGVIKEPVTNEEAVSLLGRDDASLAEDGIVRSETNASDANGIKIIDEPAKTEVRYLDNATEKAQDILERWTKDVPDLLESNVDAAQSTIEQWNAAHPEQAVDVHRALLIAGDCGAQMVNAEVDTNLNHVDNSNTPVEVNGNHKVFGEGWCNKYGFSSEEIEAVAAITDENGNLIPKNLTPEVMETIAKLDTLVSANNEVGHVDHAPVHHDGVLPRNATVNEAGEMVHAESGKGSVFTTYAGGAAGKEIVNIPEEAHYEKFDQFSKAEQHSFIPFTVTFDKVWTSTKNKFLNVIMGANGKRKNKDEREDPVIPPNPPKPVKELKALPEHQEAKALPEHQEAKVLPEHKVHKALPEYTDSSISEMIDREYKVVHGIKPNESERIRYKSLVQNEWKAENTESSFGKYLETRWDSFEKEVGYATSPLEDTKGSAETKKGMEFINSTRETVWKTNLSYDGQPLATKDVTLRHFTEIASIGKNNAEHAKLTAARDTSRTPLPRGKANKPHGGTYDLKSSSNAR